MQTSEAELMQFNSNNTNIKTCVQRQAEVKTEYRQTNPKEKARNPHSKKQVKFSGRSKDTLEKDQNKGTNYNNDLANKQGSTQT